MRSRLILPALCLSAALAAAAGAQAQSLATQRSAAAGVTVQATPRMLPGGGWEFDLAFDTHTQELKDDPAKSASLVAGGKQFPPAAWKGDPPGGHHRKGVLRFDPVSPPPEAIELRIARPGEAAPRSFRWRTR
jgi:hypothetical protein